MLKHDEAKFLDDMTVEELETQIKAPIQQIHSIDALIETCVKPHKVLTKN